VAPRRARLHARRCRSGPACGHDGGPRRQGGLILAAVHGPLPQAAKELKLAGAGAWAGDGPGAPKEARL
jgi:hypothetical protein